MFECMDADPEIIQGGATNHNGAPVLSRRGQMWVSAVS